SGGPKPEEAAANFINAMNNQDFETAKKHCTEGTYKLVDFLSGLYDMAKQEGAEFSKAEEVKVEELTCTVDGEKAKCSFCCDEEGKPTEVDMVMVNKEWKVNIEFDGFGGEDFDALLDTTIMQPGEDLFDDYEAEP